MGLAEWFSDFCTKIRVKDEESISTRYKRITKRLNLDFWNNESDSANSLYVGSYGRNTAKSGVSDIDMVMRLPFHIYEQYNKHVINGQSALLQAVRTSIKKTYPTTPHLKADGQVIVVNFDDGIHFEIMPAFINEDLSYTFPNANDGGSWGRTNPRPEIEAIRIRNNECNGNLVPLCRMARSWRDKWDVPIGGLLIDTLAYQFIDTFTHRDKSYFYYDYMCRDFFKWMSEQDQEQAWWKAPGSGQFVYGKGLFQHKAKKAHSLSVIAIEHEAAPIKREYSAKQKWREVFGSEFPD
jgi:hypothetical protein